VQVRAETLGIAHVPWVVVEVAGIEPGRRGVDLLARGADLRRYPEACRTQGDPLARSVDAVNGAGA